MTYLVINHTNYGAGMYPYGTFRTRKRAVAIAKELSKYEGDGDSWQVLPLISLEKYTDESIVDHIKSKVE